jgi:xylulokinase
MGPANDTYLLGVDLGGTGCKAAVYTLDGQCLGEGYAEYSMISTRPGQAEHDAEGWWQATGQAVAEAIEKVNPEQIAAVGVGCTNGLIAVDEYGRPLRSAIMLWDQRTLPEVEHMRAVLGAEQIETVTGNPAAPGAYSLPTILWLKHEEPDTFAKAHKFMVPGGYLVARLTGKFTVDYSRACTTLLFDIRRRRWHQTFLDALGIPLDKLPQPTPSHEVVGHVTAEAAALTGLRAGTPVIAGCMDTLGAALGSNSIEPGDYFIIMGTAARVCVSLDRPQFDRRFMNCTAAQPNRWLAIGAINGVGSSLRWARDVIALDEQRRAKADDRSVYDLMTEQAIRSPPGAKGLVFLPYLSGERTPIWNPYARGVLFGLTLGHNRADIFRALLEGPAFAIRHTVEILERENGATVQTLRIGGAAARSGVWNQIIADVLGKPVIALSGAHTEVLGAAVLAGFGVGLYPDLAEATARVAEAGTQFEPSRAANEVYNRLFPLYLRLYPPVAPYFQELVGLNLPQGWVRQDSI